MARYYRKHPEVLEEATRKITASEKKTASPKTSATAKAGAAKTLLQTTSSNREWKAFLKQTDMLRLRITEADDATRKQMLKQLKMLIKEMAR